MVSEELVQERRANGNFGVAPHVSKTSEHHVPAGGRRQVKGIEASRTAGRRDLDMAGKYTFVAL